jgi:acid phosphatase
MRIRGVLLLCAALFALTGCTGPAVPSPTATASAPPTRAVTKVLVFVMENHSLKQMRSEMPYTAGLADQFGYATAYSAIRHPSLPNYVALASGQTHGITNDGDPSVNAIAGAASIFGQAIGAGRTAGLFAEGMAGNCDPTNGGNRYAVKHNPWAYFPVERALCHEFDVPIEKLNGAIAGGDLPTVGMVVPNLCNDAHDCPLATADAWFAGWMTRVFAGPDWGSGRLAVILTADENDNSPGNTVLTVVIHPSQHAKVVTTPLSHYSLTRLCEDVAGVPYLANAATAPSMSTAFDLPVGGRP